ncbi:MAG: sialidase family protein, partial [Ktedonobacteraceae bacterium]
KGNSMRKKNIYKWLAYLAFSICLCLLTACSSNANTQPAANPTQAPVNGFGTAANHVHSLLALPSHVLVLATHYGIFRSEDSGTTWTKEAAGPHQLMEGLMAYSLGVSPLNTQRLYVLTQVAVVPHPGTLGLYTSADQGRTWKMATAYAGITSTAPFSEEPGNDTSDEVYIYLSDLGALGLRVSLDDGQHFSSTGTLPFGLIDNVLAIPGAAGQLLAYGSDGVARSVDGGLHWQVLKGINGGVNEMVTSGPHSPIYASGDAGIYTSLDEGKSFTLVNSQASYASLTTATVQKQILYGETGRSIFRSADGGHTWSALPHINGNLGRLAVDPSDAAQVYLSLSYPTAVYTFKQNGTTWQSLTPQP